MEDFTCGLELKCGTTIHLFSESAGTDPLQFAPGFDITSERTPHFGFGGGPHHCLGHFIARADMTEALKVPPGASGIRGSMASLAGCRTAAIPDPSSCRSPSTLKSEETNRAVCHTS